MIKQLVVNGCSYMETYASGQGHVDLAKQLGLEPYPSLAIGGSANSRILRTTIKHSYAAPPTMYVLGMTFLSRLEIPICEQLNEFEGRWVNPQNQEFKGRWQFGWDHHESDKFVETKLKTEVYSILDRIEDLMYRMLSVIADLKSRGHGVLMFQQADNLYADFLNDPRLALFNQPEILGKFAWRAVPWQHEQGVPPTIYPAGTQYVPKEITHPLSGHHQKLNEYLTTYIREHNLLT